MPESTRPWVNGVKPNETEGLYNAVVVRKKDQTHSHFNRHKRGGVTSNKEREREKNEYLKSWLFPVNWGSQIRQMKIKRVGLLISVEDPGLTYISESGDKPHIKATHGSEPVSSCSRTNDKSARSWARSLGLKLTARRPPAMQILTHWHWFYPY